MPHEALSRPLSLQPKYQEEQVVRRTGPPRPHAYLPQPQVGQDRGPHDYGRIEARSGGFIPEQHMLTGSCLQDLQASPPWKLRTPDILDIICSLLLTLSCFTKGSSEPSLQFST